jgi:hypothetical protein
MSVIDWVTIKTALQDLFQSGSGLADARVLFTMNGHQVNRPDGAGAWISLRFESSVTIGRPYTVEEEATGTPPAGAEINERTRSQNRIVFQATVFPPELETDATTAYAILNDVIGEAFTPPRRRALKLAGMGPLVFESILRLDGNIGSRNESRATVLFAFTAAGEKLTTNGYIQTVNIEVRDSETDALIYPFTVDLPV